MTVTDLHQSRILIRDLAVAVLEHAPNCVALVGDVLHWEGQMPDTYTVEECAHILGTLPVQHLLFVRGNHEDANWAEFVRCWPHQKRELVVAYGTQCRIAKLELVGFPCLTGSEFTWCAHLNARSNIMTVNPIQPSSELPLHWEQWLPQLMAKIGPAGRALWLLHEPPISDPLASKSSYNPSWAAAIQRYQPLIAVSGHDHDSPLRSGRWYVHLGKTCCINLGQSRERLHFCVLDYEYNDNANALPHTVTVHAFPWNQALVVQMNQARPRNQRL